MCSVFQQAQQLIDEFSFELAQKFCERALDQESDNVRALETSASLLLELGNTESAKHVSLVACLLNECLCGILFFLFLLHVYTHYVFM